MKVQRRSDAVTHHPAARKSCVCPGIARDDRLLADGEMIYDFTLCTGTDCMSLQWVSLVLRANTVPQVVSWLFHMQGYTTRCVQIWIFPKIQPHAWKSMWLENKQIPSSPAEHTWTSPTDVRFMPQRKKVVFHFDNNEGERWSCQVQSYNFRFTFPDWTSWDACITFTTIQCQHCRVPHF